MYRILGVASFLIGANACMQRPIMEQYQPLLALNFYSILLPIFVVLYDNLLPWVLNRQEILLLAISKYLCIIVYWGLMVMTAWFFFSDPIEEGTFYRTKAYGRYRSSRYVKNSTSSSSEKVAYTKKYTKESDTTKTLIALANVIITLYPIAASIYSKSIYDCKCLTRLRR